MTQKCGGGRGSAPGELTTFPKTPSWMRERLRAGRRKKYEMGREREGKRGERVRTQPPRGGTGGEVKKWVGDRLMEEGEGRGEQGRPSNGE